MKSMREEMKQLIKGLGGTLCGCNQCKPVLIGQIIDLAAVAWTEEQQKEQWLELVELWHECGATKSLQEIFKPSEWEETTECNEPHCDNGHYPLGMYGDGTVDWGECPKCRPTVNGTELTLKDPHKKALAEFLISLNLI